MSETATQMLNRILGPYMGSADTHFPKGAGYRYFQVESAKWFKPWRCCYSKRRNENGKFISWVYEYQSKRKIWTMRFKREHKKKKAARFRASKFQDKREAQINRNKQLSAV